MGHGLVPEMDPSPAYPALHRQVFWDVDSAVELAFVGHVFCTRSPEGKQYTGRR